MVLSLRRKTKGNEQFVILKFYLCDRGRKRMSFCESSENVSILVCSSLLNNLRERVKKKKCLSHKRFILPLPSSASGVKAALTRPRPVKVLQRSAVRRKKENEKAK